MTNEIKDTGDIIAAEASLVPSTDGPAPVTPAGNDNAPDVSYAPPEAFLHWYNFTFMYVDENRAANHINVFWGLPEMKVTPRTIFGIANSAAPNVDPRTMVLLNVSYLGFMSGEEFDA
jgi:hypothetical protein